MKKYGLIGYPLGHSFSAGYFVEKFSREGIAGAVYGNYPLESIDQLPELLINEPELRGLNVTIPYKEAVIPYLHRLDDEAAEAGAVNCIDIREGTLTGHNTDTYGFRYSLLELIGDDRPSALVLGTGGAAKAVRVVLERLGIKYMSVSRRPGQDNMTYDELDEAAVSAHRLIINTTPLGMFPDTGSYPAIYYDAITPSHYLFDLVYNPSETEFMKRGIIRGARVSNGMEMLKAQAEKAWEIWNR